MKERDLLNFLLAYSQCKRIKNCVNIMKKKFRENRQKIRANPGFSFEVPAFGPANILSARMAKNPGLVWNCRYN